MQCNLFFQECVYVCVCLFQVKRQTGKIFVLWNKLKGYILSLPSHWLPQREKRYCFGLRQQLTESLEFKARVQAKSIKVI